MTDSEKDSFGPIGNNEEGAITAGGGGGDGVAQGSPDLPILYQLTCRSSLTSNLVPVPLAFLSHPQLRANQGLLIWTKEQQPSVFLSNTTGELIFDISPVLHDEKQVPSLLGPNALLGFRLWQLTSKKKTAG